MGVRASIAGFPQAQPAPKACCTASKSRMTPTMAAGVSDARWTLADVLDPIEARTRRRLGPRWPYKEEEANRT